MNKKMFEYFTLKENRTVKSENGHFPTDLIPGSYCVLGDGVFRKEGSPSEIIKSPIRPEKFPKRDRYYL